MARDSPSLPLKHLLLALAVMIVWGSNFAVIKIGLDALPPLLFATLRFVFVLFPAVFFLKRPAVPWRYLIGYGVAIGAGQFGLLYVAMRHDISPGLASLVVQTQVVFTIGLSILLNGEKIAAVQLVAVALAGSGILLIAAHTGGANTPLGLALVIGAALCWAIGNIIAKQSGRVNMLAYVVWAALFSIPPLLGLSVLLEGWPAIRQALRDAGAAAWGAVLWQSAGNTLFGYTVWSWLLSRHPAAVVSPAALLVPIFGMAASAIWLGEPLPAWKLGAGSLVLGGLALNFLWPLIGPKRSLC